MTQETKMTPALQLQSPALCTLRVLLLALDGSARAQESRPVVLVLAAAAVHLLLLQDLTLRQSPGMLLSEMLRVLLQSAVAAVKGHIMLPGNLCWVGRAESFIPFGVMKRKVFDRAGTSVWS